MTGKIVAGRGFLLLGKEYEVLSVGPELLPRFRAGMKCHNLLFGRKDPCVGCPLKRVFETGERAILEWRPFPDLPAFDVFFTPILDEDGNVSVVAEEVGLSGQAALQKLQVRTASGLVDVNEELLRDRSQQQFRHKMQQQRAEEERNFIRLAAHQMQHPITLLRGYLELFLQDPSPTNHTILEEELQALSHLVSEMLTFARDTVDPQLEREQVDVVAMGRQIFETLVRQYPNRKWKFFSDEKTIFVMLDFRRAKHLLEMFLENAVKYSAPGDKIEFSLTLENDGVSAVVYDEGRGIAPENIGRVFEPFFREARDKPGTGLGLSIAKKLIEKRGGRVCVESEQGVFTRLKVWVPMAIPD